jgi:hypothetical protein
MVANPRSGVNNRPTKEVPITLEVTIFLRPRSGSVTGVYFFVGGILSLCRRLLCASIPFVLIPISFPAVDVAVPAISKKSIAEVTEISTDLSLSRALSL